MAPNPAKKFRKLSPPTTRIRKGGGLTSHITPADTPVIDPGSDTEDECDEELAQYYLNKMTDDTDRKKETVFGEGVEVWTSFGGTLYADITDDVRRKMREEELWGQGALDKVEVGGRKRKIGGGEGERVTKKMELNPDAHKRSADIDAHARPLHTPNPTTPYPDRDPEATHFHHSSAGINPLGAHARPIKPLPKRRLPLSTPQVTSSATRVGIQGPSPPLAYPLPRSSQVPHPHTSQTSNTHTKGHVQITPTPGRGEVPTTPSDRVHPLPAVRPSRIVSGSFGSFDGSGQGRFDERKYRLGPKGDGGKKDEEDKGKGKGKGEKGLDLFKGKPWLRR
jgi:hypothetical protein